MNKYIISVIVIFQFLLMSCNSDKKESLTLDQVRYNTNKSGYPTAKLDSAQAIVQITKQKLREVMELSLLYQSGNKNTEIDQAVYRQALGYFHKPDSSSLKNLLSEIDSLKVKNVNVNNLSVGEKINKTDTVKVAKFDVEYFDKNNNSLGRFPRTAYYKMMPSEVRFKKEFKFYFTEFYPKLKQDSAVIR